MDSQTGFMAPISDQSLGKELNEAYNKASLFPHIVTDDFLLPALLDRVVEHTATIEVNEDDALYDHAQQRCKTSYQPDSLSDDVCRILG